MKLQLANLLRAPLERADLTTVKCKLCEGACVEAFRLPRSKLTGHDIPDAPDDCPYFRCQACDFLFATVIDDVDNTTVYDEDYWQHQDPDWHGRIGQTLRLVMLANKLIGKNPWELKVLDFGCGMGAFVQSGRNDLQMNVWGTDIIEPKLGVEHYMRELPPKFFDVVVACEVIEHLPQPLQAMRDIKNTVKEGGVFAYQTAYYDPAVCGRDWWYLGPANGHISLYSVKAFDWLFNELGGRRRLSWNGYPGVQAWQF